MRIPYDYIILVIIGIIVLIVLKYIAKRNRFHNALKYHFLKQNFDKAEQLYAEEENSGNIDATLYLARLFHEGMRDHAPDPRKALKYYKKALNRGIYFCLLDIGDIYNYGLDNLDPDPKKAGKYYKQLYNICRKHHTPLNLFYLSKVKERLQDLGVHDMFQVSQVPVPQQLVQVIETQPRNQTLNHDFTATIRTRIREEPQRINQRNPIPAAPQPIDNPVEIRNDPQNVHDSFINKSIFAALQKLKNNTNLTIPLETAFYEITQAIRGSRISEKRKHQALSALNSLGNDHIGANNMSERELIQLVWNRINSGVFQNDRETPIENLVSELADCTENGRLVCATGKFARILDSLNKIDPVVDIKPKWAFQREQMDTAQALRKQLLAQSPPEVQAAVNETAHLTPEKERLIDEFSNKLKTEIMTKFRNDYVASGLMTEETLQNEVNTWLDYI